MDPQTQTPETVVSPNPSPAPPPPAPAPSNPAVAPVAPSPPNPPVPPGPSVSGPVVSSPVAPQVQAPSNTPQPPNPSPGTAEPEEYISNPFLNCVRGIITMLRVNPVASLLSGLVGVILMVASYFLFIVASAASGSIVVALVLGLVMGLIFVLPFGSFFAIGVSSARNEHVTTGEAYSKALKKLFPLIILAILSAIIITVGFLLLVIPGIYLMGRLALSGLVLFEEDLGPIKAIKRSFELTKGHVNEMLGSLFASGLISGGSAGLLFGVTSVAPAVGRYRDIRNLQESGAPKPPIHWLNYIYVAVIVLIVLPMAMVIYGYSKSSNVTPSSSSTFQSKDFKSDSSSSTDSYNSDSSSSSDSSFYAQ